MCLGISDGSLLPVFAHMLGSKKVRRSPSCMFEEMPEGSFVKGAFHSSAQVYSLEPSRMSRQVIEQVNNHLFLFTLCFFLSFWTVLFALTQILPQILVDLSHICLCSCWRPTP